ncbi:MAG TPA: ROK family protein [Verrucomicrobiae bacterium]|jgi:glucokinase|nr:ROK family protein [Verrucomicrobiae bacterium]
MKTMAVDFGGRRIKLGLICNGTVLAQKIIAAQAEKPLRDRLDSLADALHQLCADAGTTARECDGLAIAYPSIIDTANARILDHFGKFSDGSSFNFREWAERTFGLPLAMDNDARMALIGEWRYGEWNDCNDIVMITLGTGIGVSAVLGGQVMRGAHGQAGILGGHITVNHLGRACICGNIGCAEAEASTSVLEKKFREKATHANIIPEESLVDYAAVFRLASEGDPRAKALADHSVQVWSALAVSLIHVFDPELLIMGGGVMGSADLILPQIQDYVNRHAHTPWGKVTVAASSLGEKAALLAGEWLLEDYLAA